MRKAFILSLAFVFVICVLSATGQPEEIWERGEESGEWIKYHKIKKERMKLADINKRERKLQKEIDTLASVRDLKLSADQLDVLSSLLSPFVTAKDGKYKLIRFRIRLQQQINRKTKSQKALPLRGASPGPGPGR